MDLYEAHRENPDIFRQFAVKDILFLYYKCPQRDKIIKLYSKHVQINFTISGSRLLRHGEKACVTNHKTGVLLKRGAFLQEMQHTWEGWDVLVFYLKDDYLRSIFDEFRPHLQLNSLPNINKDAFESFEIDSQIKSCYESIIPYFDKDKPIPETILENKFKELLFNIFSHPKNKHILAYILSIVERYQTPIWEVMETNYMFDLKLNEFADISNRSLSKFKRNFKDYYNQPPGKWLTVRRLQRAKSDLQTTKKTVQEIAFDCGFKNPSHFSRVFKEHYNTSPSTYRNDLN